MNDWIQDELAKITEAGLLRQTRAVTAIGHGTITMDGRDLIDFASNDYLGLSHREELTKAAAEAAKRWGCGSRASRLMSGSIGLLHRLEQAVAEFQGTEAALCLGNGYLANCTIIPAIARRGDAIFLDRLCHASIIDGVLLSGAIFFRFAHNDAAQLEQLLRENRHLYRRALVIAETVYSMDGDMAPVERLMALRQEFNTMLMLDEAHAIGIFGEHAEGIIPRHQERKPDILIGTFGKALGSYGAFAACDRNMKRFLQNRCRGFIFSTALPPPVAAANLAALELLESTGGERHRVLDLAADLRDFIEARLGKATSGSSQIVPLILDNVQKTLDLERYLADAGIFARAIRPPTVPGNTPRIRFSITADHNDQDIERLKAVLLSFFKT